MLLVQVADLDTCFPETVFGDNIRLHGGYIHPCDALRTPFAVTVAFCWAMESSSKTLLKNIKPKGKTKQTNKHTC